MNIFGKFYYCNAWNLPPELLLLPGVPVSKDPMKVSEKVKLEQHQKHMITHECANHAVQYNHHGMHRIKQNMITGI